jgi:hypothetical protein
MTMYLISRILLFQSFPVSPCVAHFFVDRLVYEWLQLSNGQGTGQAVINKINAGEYISEGIFLLKQGLDVFNPVDNAPPNIVVGDVVILSGLFQRSRFLIEELDGENDFHCAPPTIKAISVRALLHFLRVTTFSFITVINFSFCDC